MGHQRILAMIVHAAGCTTDPRTTSEGIECGVGCDVHGTDADTFTEDNGGDTGALDAVAALAAGQICELNGGAANRITVLRVA